MSLDCFIVTFRTSHKECETPVNTWQEAGVFESQLDAEQCYASISLSGKCTGKLLASFDVIEGCTPKFRASDSSFRPEPYSMAEEVELDSLKRAVTNAVEAYVLSVQRERYTSEMDAHARKAGF